MIIMKECVVFVLDLLFLPKLTLSSFSTYEYLLDRIPSYLMYTRLELYDI